MKRFHALLSPIAIAAVVIVALAFVSCGPKPASDYLVVGQATLDSGFLDGQVVLLKNGDYMPTVEGATASINGEALTPFFYLLLGSVTPVAPDADVTFRIDIESTSVNKTLKMPNTVIISQPVTGSTHSAGSPLTVSWTGHAGVTEPGYVQVRVDGDYTVSGNDYSSIVPYSSSSTTIPAGTLKTGTAVIDVDGANLQLLSGSGLVSGSNLTVTNRLSVSNVTMN